MGDDDLIRRGDAVKAMADYHWKRYASRAEGGTLSSPAVFTSHTWQDVQDAIRALPAAPAEDVRAGALKEAAQTVWLVADVQKSLGDMNGMRACGKAAQAVIALIPEGKP
ncbi:MAG: hypothetical protein RSE12_17220 [Fuscovulum sp.]|nr:MAG: hypothetical protein RSE12_17220 [Fuscovulum sp.]